MGLPLLNRSHRQIRNWGGWRQATPALQAWAKDASMGRAFGLTGLNVGSPLAAASLVFLSAQAPAQAQSRFDTGGKLELTRGISTIEGEGGGGLTPWAVITGDETNRGIGASAHVSGVELPDYRFLSYGAAVGLFDRFELSYTREQFDTENVGAALGLGKGFTFDQDVVGAKVRLAGDAVYSQDNWLPQIALGALWKHNDKSDVIHALGAKDDEGWETYASATKILLGDS